MEEALLVRRLQQGDTEAFDALYLQYRDAVLRAAALITGSRADGEDVTQETFVQCYQRIGRLCLSYGTDARESAVFQNATFRVGEMVYSVYTSDTVVNANTLFDAAAEIIAAAQ